MTSIIIEGTTGFIDVTPSVPPQYLCDSTISGTVHIEAKLKRKKSHDYSCRSKHRSIAQAVFSSVDDTNSACGAPMDGAAWTSGKVYRISIRPKDDRRRERKRYTRTVYIYVVKVVGGVEVCRRRIKDIEVGV